MHVKIDKSISNFQFNVAIAQFYEAYRYFYESTKNDINSENLKNAWINILKLMIPFTPHIASECLTKLSCKEIHSSLRRALDAVLKFFNFVSFARGCILMWSAPAGSEQLMF